MDESFKMLCLVEDDPIMGESIRDRLTLEGYLVDWYKSAENAVPRICSGQYQILISDIRLPGMSGEEMFKSLIDNCVSVPETIFITGYGSVKDAVRLLKLGAIDFIVKPFDIETFIEKIDKLSTTDSKSDAIDSQLNLGVSLPMRQVENILRKVAKYPADILISGETGVGKEVVACRLHQLRSVNVELPFVAVNCGALPESLLEAELFGFEKGAFTGAISTKIGYFEQAQGGTLFLDEIAEMPLPMQVKLLRAIQERTIQRIGGVKEIKVNFRLISATNADPLEAIQTGRLREDLFYRLNGVHIKLLPLRQRKEDISWLAEKFLDEYFCENIDQKKKNLSESAREALTYHDWKGNARELKHCIERACMLSKENTINPDDLVDGEEVSECENQTQRELKPYLERCERQHLVEILDTNNWQIEKSAKQLGVSRKNLWERMKRLEIRSQK